MPVSTPQAAILSRLVLLRSAEMVVSVNAHSLPEDNP
jgi:hypothetical protein